MRGIGTDVIEISRIQELKRREQFVEKLLSVEERKLYDGFTSVSRRDEFLAGRWALKEAIYKALTDFCQGKAYKDFSILNDEQGKPYLFKPTVEGLHLSVSHCRHYVVAFVVAE